MKFQILFPARLLFCFIFFLLGKMTFAQDCELPTANLSLAGNNISARINIGGELFRNRESNMTAFHASNSVFPFRSTLSTHGLWIGAIDQNEEIRIAAAKYNYQNNFDYTAGPISGNCEDYDRLWEVFGYEIQQHISDFEDNGIIDNPIPNIMAYPAHQNPLFETIHGFALPDTPQGLAPFFDNNNDGIYDPLDGDYPLPHHVAPGVIPSHIVWGIFNDGDAYNTTSGSQPLNIEVQLTAWSLVCTDNEQINNTIFTSHKIINRGTTSLDSTFIGFHTDGDLGCYTDDYFGCIPDLNTYYLYNQDPVDGSPGNTCLLNIPTYGDNPPVQAVTFLNRSMSSLNYFKDNGSVTAAPSQPNEYYNYLNGRWRDGSPLTVGGSGYNPSIPQAEETKFAFPDNPNSSASNDWSMYSSNLPPLINSIISTTKVGNFLSNESITLDLAFTFYQDENLDHIESVNIVYDQTPILQQLYDNQFSNVCEINHTVCENDCVWTGDANRDSIVNTFDFLQIGVAQGESGTERNKPLIWYPYTGENWNSTIQDIDLKHTDCNGDGIINEIDFELSAFYLQNSYKTIPPTDTYNQGDELSIITPSNFNLSSINVGETGRCYVNQNQAIDLYGITFTLEYDPSFLKLNTSLGNAPSNPWSPAPTTTNEFYNFYDVEAFKGNITSCYVKTDGINGLSKDGNLLMVYFDPIPTDYAQIQTLIKLKNIKAILNDGSQIDYGANELEVNIFNPDGSGVLLNNEGFAKENIEIFPNPTTHLLNIKFNITTNAQFSIFDIYGKNVFQQKVNNNKETTLPIEHLSSGIYFLKIKMEGKEITHKFVKI